MLAGVAVFGIQSVAAQTEATSTAPVDGTTVEQPPEASTEAATTSDSTALGAATTTEAAPPVAVSTSTPPEPSSSEDTEITDAPTPAAVAADVSALQENYYQKTGSYLQILRGNGLPTYETGTVVEKLGESISSDAWVHVYEAPAGKGYQVLYEADGVLHSVGYGPEAAERTFSRSTIVAPNATSTMP